MEYHQCQRSHSSSSSSSHSNHHHQPGPAAFHHCLATLRGRNSTSYTSSLALNGKFLYAGSSDREISSWNRHQHEQHSASAAGKGAVKSLVIQSDRLFSAHQDHKIRVWRISQSPHEPDQQQHTRVATLPTLGDRAAKVLLPKNHVQIRRHKKRTWVHHVDAVSALALSGDGALLYSVSWDRTIKIWRTRDFTCLESVGNAHDDAINAVAVSRGGRVYSGSADKTIKVWERGEGEKKHALVDTLERHKSGINALALSGDESLLYSGACDRSILVWEKGGDRGGMAVVGALRGHTKSILCLAVVSDLVCSGSADKTIRVWRGFHGEYSCLAVLEGHLGPIKCLGAVVDHSNSSDSQASFLLYSGSLDCNIKVWQIFVPTLNF